MYKKLLIGALFLFTLYLWKDFHLPLIATFKITLGSLGLSGMMAIILAGVIPCQPLRIFALLQKVLGLWMILPPLLITFILFQAWGTGWGVQGTIFVLAVCKFPFLFNALIEAKKGYNHTLKTLVSLSRLTPFQKLRYIYSPLFLPVLRQHMGVQASYGIGAFSVPLLLCVAEDRPLAPTLFYLTFEDQKYGVALLLLIYSGLWSLLLNGVRDILFLKNAPNRYPLEAPLPAYSWQESITLLPLIFFLYPLLWQGGKMLAEGTKGGMDFSDILMPLGASLGLGISSACFTLFISILLVLRCPKLSEILLQAPLALPPLFWGIGIGGAAIYYDFPPYVILLLYLVLLAFITQPYILSVLLPVKRKVQKDLGSLVALSRLGAWTQLRYLWLPYLKTEMRLCFLYSFALTLGEVTLFFCLSPLETPTLAIELYNCLLNFNWSQARLIAFVMMILFVSLTLGSLRHAKS